MGVPPVRTAAVVLCAAVAWSCVAPTSVKAADASRPTWLPVEQPDLRDQIVNAKPLTVERLPVTPVRSIRVAGLMWAPNPDGRTWDIVQVYYGQSLRNNWIVVIDLGRGTVKVTKQPNQKERFDYRLGPDGKVWTFIDEVLVRIHPDDARIEVIGDLRFTNWHNPRGPGRIAFAGNDIYLAGYQELRRVRGIVTGSGE